MIDSLKNIDAVQAEYSEKYEAFYDKFCGWEDGKAAENTVKAVFD